MTPGKFVGKKIIGEFLPLIAVSEASTHSVMGVMIV
jgi:hypothetical protein